MNDFYNASGYPAQKQKGDSAPARTEFSAIAAAFDKFPGLAGNAGKIVAVNSGGTGLEAVSSLAAATTGTWTPSVGGTATYGAENNGTYMRIGGLVFITGCLHISSIGTGSRFRIYGLPIAASLDATHRTSIAIGAFTGLSQSVVFVGGVVISTSIYLTAMLSAGINCTINTNDILRNGTIIYFSGCYIAA